MVPNYYPEHNVSEINLQTEAFGEDTPPHIPLTEDFGEILVRASGHLPDVIMRRALKSDGVWNVDPSLSITMFTPTGAEIAAVVVIEKRHSDKEPARDYYQCIEAKCPKYAANVMSRRPDEKPNEQWFVSVVNDAILAADLDSLGVLELSSAIIDRLEIQPEELVRYGCPDSIGCEDYPNSDIFDVGIES